MKKIKLLASLCIITTLGLGISCENSGVQNNNNKDGITKKEEMEQNEIDKNNLEEEPRNIEEPIVEEPPNNEVEEPIVETPPSNNVEEPIVETPPSNNVEEPILETPPSNNVEEPIVETPPNNNIEEPSVENTPNNNLENHIIEMPPNEIEIPNNIEGDTPSDKPNNNQSDSFISEIEQSIFATVNKERAANGLTALSYNNTMEKYARIKSQDMGDRGYFAHEDPQGKLITEQMKRDGVTYNAWGENIAYIQGNQSNASLANQFMTNWMNSPGHRGNILSGNFTSIGIGVYKIGNTYYATQEFYR